MRVSNWHTGKRHHGWYEATLDLNEQLSCIKYSGNGTPYFTICRDGKQMQVYLSSKSDIDFLIKDLQKLKT